MFGQVMLAAEFLGDFFSDDRVVTAFAFGDVMKKSGDIEELRFRDLQENIIAEGEFVDVFFEREAA